MFDLNVIRRGKRGPIPQHGMKLCLDDINENPVKIGDFTVYSREVVAEIANRQKVYAFVTSTNSGSKRLFFSTLSANSLNFENYIPVQEDFQYYSRPNNREQGYLLNYIIYAQRWSIEVIFYEMKTFWGLGTYMVRHINSIEILINQSSPNLSVNLKISL